MSRDHLAVNLAMSRSISLATRRPIRRPIRPAISPEVGKPRRRGFVVPCCAARDRAARNPAQRAAGG